MKTKLLPAYLPESSHTLRINPDDMAKFLLRCDTDYLKKLVRSLSKESYCYDNTRLRHAISVLSKLNP